MAEISSAELIDLIVRRAEDLRRAGVLSIEVGGFKAQLAPYQGAIVSDKAQEPEPEPAQLFRVPGGLRHLEVTEEKVSKK